MSSRYSMISSSSKTKTSKHHSSQSRVERLQNESISWRKSAKQACNVSLPQIGRHHGTEIEILCFSPMQSMKTGKYSKYHTVLDDIDWSVWHLIIRGPKMTPYVGGLFELTIKVPKNYPNCSPKFEFRAPMIPLSPFISYKTGSIEHPLYNVLYEPSMTLIHSSLLLLHDVFFTPRFALYRNYILNSTLALSLDISPVETCLNISSNIIRDVSMDEMTVDLTSSDGSSTTTIIGSGRRISDSYHYDSIPSHFRYKHPDELLLPKNENERPLEQGCSMEEFRMRRNQIIKCLKGWENFSQDLIDILFDYYGTVQHHCYFGRFDIGYGPGRLLRDCYPKIESDTLAKQELRVKELHRRTISGGSSDQVFTLPVSLKIVFPERSSDSGSTADATHSGGDRGGAATSDSSRLTASDAKGTTVSKSSSAGTLEKLHKIYIDVCPEFTIKDVKLLIWARQGIEIEHQHLIADKKLYNWLSLDEFDFRAYAFRSRTVFCMVKEEHSKSILTSAATRATSSSVSTPARPATGLDKSDIIDDAHTLTVVATDATVSPVE